MKKSVKILAAALMGFAAVACSSASKMAELADNVKVTCEPEVLEVVAGNVDADLTVTVPEKYFHPKAIVEVTPVLVYEGGEAAMESFKYQGEKVKNNYKVVAAKAQTVVKESVHFDYVKGMEKAQLELRGVVKFKSKSVTLPTKKVAVGCNTTYMLVETDGEVPYKADNYQAIIAQTEEGQILYRINSDNVAYSQLKSQSIKDFQTALDEIKNNERKTLTGTEVVAYASPDGGQSLNAKLSDRRAKSADKAWNKITKGKTVTDPEVKSVGQDWEGFQELVSESDIEDKDLILRVLSMYSDPAVRENEIKNMSEVYTSLKKEVLPELRRARFIANVEYKNYTSEELLKLVDENIDVLDEEALLRAATLVKKNSDKIDLYKKAVEKFNSDRAQFNLGVAYLNSNKVGDAKKAFAKVNTQDADLENALGVIELREGNYAAASKHFAKSGTEAAKANQAAVDILNGNYEQAVKALAGTKSFNTGLAYLLVNQPQKVEGALSCQCPKSNYLRAIAAARQGNSAKVSEYLAKATKLKALKARLENDIEFAQYK